MGINPERRMTFNRLLRLTGEITDLGEEPTTDDYVHAEPPSIETGLYIGPRDPRFASGEQLVRVGVPAHPVTATTRDFGVVFPSDEFSVVARSPRDFARHTEARTRNANLVNDNRDEVDEKVRRSVIHALDSKVKSISKLSIDLGTERTALLSLYRDLNYSWQAHHKVRNLAKLRIFADEKIHETAELATINLEMDTVAIKGLHRAIKKNLYGGNRSHARTAFNWQRYIKMVGTHTKAKLEKADISQRMCEKELDRYKYRLTSGQHAA
jgi:hypothetical protein